MRRLGLLTRCRNETRSDDESPEGCTLDDIRDGPAILCESYFEHTQQNDPSSPNQQGESVFEGDTIGVCGIKHPGFRLMELNFYRESRKCFGQGRPAVPDIEMSKSLDPVLAIRSDESSCDGDLNIESLLNEIRSFDLVGGTAFTHSEKWRDTSYSKPRRQHDAFSVKYSNQVDTFGRVSMEDLSLVQPHATNEAALGSDTSRSLEAPSSAIDGANDTIPCVQEFGNQQTNEQPEQPNDGRDNNASTMSSVSLPPMLYSACAEILSDDDLLLIVESIWTTRRESHDPFDDILVFTTSRDFNLEQCAVLDALHSIHKRLPDVATIPSSSSCSSGVGSAGDLHEIQVPQRNWSDDPFDAVFYFTTEFDFKVDQEKLSETIKSVNARLQERPVITSLPSPHGLANPVDETTVKSHHQISIDTMSHSYPVVLQDTNSSFQSNRCDHAQFAMNDNISKQENSEREDDMGAILALSSKTLDSYCDHSLDPYDDVFYFTTEFDFKLNPEQIDKAVASIRKRVLETRLHATAEQSVTPIPKESFQDTFATSSNPNLESKSTCIDRRELHLMYDDGAVSTVNEKSLDHEHTNSSNSPVDQGEQFQKLQSLCSLIGFSEEMIPDNVESSDPFDDVLFFTTEFDFEVDQRQISDVVNSINNRLVAARDQSEATRVERRNYKLGRDAMARSVPKESSQNAVGKPEESNLPGNDRYDETFGSTRSGLAHLDEANVENEALGEPVEAGLWQFFHHALVDTTLTSMSDYDESTSLAIQTSNVLSTTAQSDDAVESSLNDVWSSEDPEKRRTTKLPAPMERLPGTSASDAPLDQGEQFQKLQSLCSLIGFSEEMIPDNVDSSDPFDDVLFFTTEFDFEVDQRQISDVVSSVNNRLVAETTRVERRNHKSGRDAMARSAPKESSQNAVGTPEVSNLPRNDRYDETFESTRSGRAHVDEANVENETLGEPIEAGLWQFFHHALVDTTLASMSDFDESASPAIQTSHTLSMTARWEDVVESSLNDVLSADDPEKRLTSKSPAPIERLPGTFASSSRANLDSKSTCIDHRERQLTNDDDAMSTMNEKSLDHEHANSSNAPLDQGEQFQKLQSLCSLIGFSEEMIPDNVESSDPFDDVLFFTTEFDFEVDQRQISDVVNSINNRLVAARDQSEATRVERRNYKLGRDAMERSAPKESSQNAVGTPEESNFPGNDIYDETFGSTRSGLAHVDEANMENEAPSEPIEDDLWQFFHHAMVDTSLTAAGSDCDESESLAIQASQALSMPTQSEDVVASSLSEVLSSDDSTIDIRTSFTDTSQERSCVPIFRTDSLVTNDSNKITFGDAFCDRFEVWGRICLVNSEDSY